MVTARRSSAYAAEENRAASAVDLLERKSPETFGEYTSVPEREENLEEAKLRMQKNLDRLLNYDRSSEESLYAEAVTDNLDVAPSYADENIVSATEMGADEAVTEDDIRPTSTTMQFGDGNSEPVLSDMVRQKEEQKESYRLNAKGKLVVALYAVAVALILALIVINTGVLAVLSKSSAESAAVLSAKIAEYNAVAEEINAASSQEHIIEIAENVLGMIK